MIYKGYPADFFHINKILEKFVGFWTPKNGVLRLVYYVYVLISYIFIVTFYICEYIILQETSKDLNKFFKQFGMLFTHSVGLVKCYILFYHRDSIKKIMNGLQDKDYIYQDMDDFYPTVIVNQAKRFSDAVSTMIMVLYTFVGTSAHISATVTLTKVVEGNKFQGNMTCYDLLPYYFYIPINVETKYQCQMVLSYMDASMALFAWRIAVHDCVFVTLMNSLRTQLQIVQAAIRTIRARCLDMLNLPADYTVFHDDDDAELEVTLYSELNHYTKHLNVLLQIRDEIERVFSYGTLAQTVTSLIVFASCLYVASTVPLTSPDFFAHMEYFVCVLLQLSVICYFGNEVTVASAQTGKYLYQCDWFSSSSRFKRSMFVTMSRFQRPVYISIGKFSPLTLVTLVAVCRGSFSYLTLFKSIQ